MATSMAHGSGRVIRELNASVWESLLGSRWAEKSHRALDFSSDVFNLESLSGPDGGLWNPLLNLKHLEELNLTKNKLSDVDRIFVSDAPFANSLKTLTLCKNLLISPLIDLQFLVVLDISYNLLESLPCLDYLPNLEVLRLSHNRIETVWDTIGKCLKLKELDVSDNLITIYPSQIEWGVHYLKQCPELTGIHLAGNPFSNWFPEYQYFVALSLPSLTRIDDWVINESMRAQITRFPLRSLEEYDQVFSQRQLFADLGHSSARKQRPDDESIVLDEVPSLDFFNTHLNHAAQMPENAVDSCSRIVSGAEFINNSAPTEFGRLFGAAGPPPGIAGQPGRVKIPTTPTGQDVVAQFLQNVTLLVEKHENVQPLLLRALARLGCVPNENLGPLCLSTLGDMMKGGDELAEAVAKAIEESVAPMIQGHSLTDTKCATIIKGLSLMRPTVYLARSLSAAVTDIAAFLEDEPNDPALIAVLAMVVDFPPNAVECSGQAVPQLVCEVLKHDFASEHPELSDETFVHLLHIAGCCSEHVKKAATHFVREEVHTKFVFQRLKEYFKTPDTSNWTLKQARVVSAMIDFLTGIIQTNEQGMADCVDSFHLTDLLLIPLKEYCSNPLILAAALRGIVAILNDETRVKLLEYITEQIERVSPLLQYIGGRVYKDLCDLGERHILGQDTLPYRPSIPEMQFCSNPYVHSVFVGIGSLIKFYLDHPEIPYCMVINEFLGTKNREKLLFRLLVVPSIAVKVVAIGSLSKVPIENFDAEDVEVILGLLRSFRAFQSDDAASLVVALLALLGKFVDDTVGEPGRIIRNERPRETFDSVFELLCKAVAVPSKSLESEKSKMKICLACVDFLRAASRHLEFREFLRSKGIAQMFRAITASEEETCLPESPDVAVEKCWTGRDLILLLRCFAGQGRLSPKKKVAFRIMNQIADVLEGRAGILDFGTDVTLQSLCRREARPFSESEVRKQLRLLDESEWADRMDQQLEFVKAKGPEKILTYLTRLAAADFDVRQAVERKMKRHSEYWAGRLKGKKERMEKDLYEGIEIDENLEDPVRFQFYPKPDSYEDEGRWVMMQALHRCDHSLDPDISALYLRCGAGFYGSGTVWENIACGEVRASFIVSALLRCLYACMIVPITDEVSRHTISCVREPQTLRRLVSLLEVVQLFDCHVGAKFLAVVRLAITLEPHQSAESMDLIITYDIICQTLLRIFRPFLHILKQSRSKPLEQSEQIFSTEVARLLAVVSKQTSYIKFSSQLIVQKWCVKKGLLRFIDIMAIKTLVAMVIYDLQVAAGSSRGTYISHLLETTAAQREEMRESCLSVLSEVVQCCEPLKYTVCEAFNVAEVFQHAAVRRTFLFELLESANCGHYRQAVQLFLSVEHQRAERVLQLPVVHHWVAKLGQADPHQKIIALTNYSFYLLYKPEGIRNFKASASQTSTLNATAPYIEATREFSSMTRIVRGYPPDQVLFVGWMQPGTTKEFYDIFVCNKLLSSLPLLQCLYALSGPDVESRVDVYRDVITKFCLKEHVKLEQIKAVTYVIRETPQKRYLALHVLTENHLYEFIIDWRYWFSPSPEVIRPSNWQTLGEESSDEDIEEEYEPYDDLIIRKQKKGLDNFLGYTEEAGTESTWDKDLVAQSRAAALGVGVLQELPDWTRIDEEETRSSGLREQYRQKLDVAKHNFLTLVKKWRLTRLHELSFGVLDEPVVTYRFALKVEKKEDEEEYDQGDEEEEEDEDEEEKEVEKPKIQYDDVRVVYLDDSSRERWRQGVAYGLNLLETSGQWRRTWRQKMKM